MNRDSAAYLDHRLSRASLSPWLRYTRIDHEKTFTSGPSESSKGSENMSHTNKPHSYYQTRADEFEELKRRIEADPYGAIFGRRLDRLLHKAEDSMWSSLTRAMDSMERNPASLSNSQLGEKPGNSALKQNSHQQSSSQEDIRRQRNPEYKAAPIDNSPSVVYEYDPISMRNVPRNERLSKPGTKPDSQSRQTTGTAVNIPVKKFRDVSNPSSNTKRDTVKLDENPLSGRDQAAPSATGNNADPLGSKQNATAAFDEVYNSSRRASAGLKADRSATKDTVLKAGKVDVEIDAPLFSGTTYERKARSIMTRYGDNTSGWLLREGFSTPNRAESSSFPKSKPMSSKSISATNKMEPSLDRFQTPKQDFKLRSPTTTTPLATYPESLKPLEQDMKKAKQIGIESTPHRNNVISSTLSHGNQSSIGRNNASQEEEDLSEMPSADCAKRQKFLSKLGEKSSSERLSTTDSAGGTDAGILSRSSPPSTGSKDSHTRPNEPLEENSAVTPAEASQFNSQNRTMDRKSVFEPPNSPKTARDVAQKEDSQAKALEEQARNEARTADLQKNTEQRKVEAEKKDQSLRALIPELKRLYEERYGKISADHRQKAKLEADEAQPEKNESMIASTEDPVGKTKDIFLNPQGNERGDWWQRRKIMKDKFAMLSKANVSNTTAEAATYEQRHDYDQPWREKSSFSQGATDVQQDEGDTSGAKPATTALYKVLAYDKSTRRITIAETASSFVHIKEEPLHPTEILSKLNRAAKFLPYLEDLQNEGFEVVSGHGDILIFKKTEHAISSTPARFMSTMERAAAPSDALEQTHPTTSNPKIRRQEPVFSGSGQTWQEGSRKTTSTPSRFKRIAKEVLISCTITAGIFYAIGAMSEAAQNDGKEYRAKGRPGIYSTLDSR